MSTPETVKAALQAAIDTANTATGKADTTVAAAVASLVEGFSQGGSGERYETGTFTGDRTKGFSIPVSFEPKQFCIMLENDSTHTENHIYSLFSAKDLCWLGYVRAANTSTTTRGTSAIKDEGFGFSGTFEYQDGVFHASNLAVTGRAFANGRTYVWECWG